MRITTWNINSIRTRTERVLAFLERSDTDILALQETKCRDDQFPIAPFEEAGYHVAMHGLNQWNGVAVISKHPIINVQVAFPGQPEFKDVVEARALGVTVDAPGGPVTVWSLYIPNGRELEDPHYDYKLAWLRQLAEVGKGWLQQDPEALIALVGDWNVAPEDTDVWDIDFFEGKTHVSVPEREALAQISVAGFKEVTRERVNNYTYWDYQKLRFPKNEGMRIDFVFASPALASRITGAEIDRDERKGKGASDHVPVSVDYI